ncbi:MAG: hypothetical protein PHS44_05940, partial [Candidatus Dojkabacteria bacterium]|nr:hypothetical protein [Candidatus Dojkabacteria bacterium]
MKRIYFQIIFIILAFVAFMVVGVSDAFAVSPNIRVVIWDNGTKINAPAGGYVEWKDNFMGGGYGNNRRWVNNSVYLGDHLVYGYYFQSMQSAFNQIADTHCGNHWNGSGDFCLNWNDFRDALGIREQGVGSIVFTQAEWYNGRSKGDCQLRDMRYAKPHVCHDDCKQTCTDGCIG